MPGKLLDAMNDFTEVQLPESRVLIVITGMAELLKHFFEIVLTFLKGGTICMQKSENGLVPVSLLHFQYTSLASNMIIGERVSQSRPGSATLLQ
jgi:hypothetical protein